MWRFRLKNRFLLSPVSGLKKWQRKEGECKDINTYKTSVGDDIDAWLKILHLYHIQDCIIILVETYDVKKANKLLPRTTVLDKIRSDFAAKIADRCFAVINPIKSESRSAESWRGLITRIRHLMLIAYDRTLSRFEDIIREQRERRNNPNWNFCHYFLLQEELVFELNHHLRFLLVECKASLLDLRSYLNNNNDNLE
ncbi:hypothetical protein DMN91_010421 [Ooceraea biroi]|uniref:TRAPPC10/Trs130 N-terminal domain-containing protein n=1 Tax=Ooceraea biroi TaxID=2015173 RepID=A0A3L8DE39_OOCBI|nr:hypothetical protein DMN91_010421 [Ooceraea biroi]